MGYGGAAAATACRHACAATRWPACVAACQPACIETWKTSPFNQVWNMSTWQAETEFFEPRIYGFASRDSISLSRDSIFFGPQIPYLGHKKPFTRSKFIYKVHAHVIPNL
jgi:hypothetical protein